MKVSVIIPTRDRMNFLRQALDSVLGQTYRNFEIIVIDNGSVDGTPELLRSLRHCLTADREEAGGKSRALNRAMQHVSGEAVLVLDDDDLIPADSLANHVAALDASPEAGFSYGRFVRFEGGGSEIMRGVWNHEQMEAVPSDDPRRTVIKLMEHCFLPHPTWMARRGALEHAGPYDVERLRSQDYDMVLRLARQSDGVFVDAVTLLQRQHAQARVGAVQSVGSNDVARAWSHHDRIIFETLARTWSLDDFRPFATPLRDDRSYRLALLQKGVILFQRRCFTEAIETLHSYCRSAAAPLAARMERAIASRLFARQIAPELLGTTELARKVSRELRKLDWPHAIARDIAQGARWQIRRALLRGEFRFAMAATRFLTASFGASPTLFGVSARHSLPSLTNPFPDAPPLACHHPGA